MSNRTVGSLAVLLFTAATAYATNNVVGGCLQGSQNFPTIQAAVNAVPASSTIFVCPGVYPEQITISKPLTLRGLGFNNHDRPTITVPGGDPALGGGLKANVTSILGYQFAAQVLVQNVTPPGNVTIFNMTVDGSGANLNCSGASQSVNLAGIFYASGTSGTVQASTLRNQKNFGCGNGIWLENGNVSGTTIAISGNSVHDFDDIGIAAWSNQNPPTLTVNFANNSVHSSNNFTDAGIFVNNVLGSVQHNVITGSGTGISDVAFSATQTSAFTINNNDIANTSIGIATRPGSTAKSNRISNTQFAFFLVGGMGANPGPFLFANTIKKTVYAVEYNCTANVSLKSNTINDAQIAFDNAPLNFTISNGVNPLYNVDTLASGTCQ